MHISSLEDFLVIMNLGLTLMGGLGVKYMKYEDISCLHNKTNRCEQSVVLIYRALHGLMV